MSQIEQIKQTSGTAAEELLRGAFLANAVFSGFSGLAFLALTDPLATWIGLTPAWILWLIGGGLIVYAGLLVWFHKKAVLRPFQAWFAIGNDLAWVAGSAVLLGGFPNFLNPIGQGLVAIIALIVLALAALQGHALRRWEA